MTTPDPHPREERRVVTVVFTDLVGFTERSEELDPEDVRAMLAAYYGQARSVFEEYGGTVDKFIGDAVLAVFGAPVAHEDDPERAVRAALAICEWARAREDISLRAGVNTGTAFVALEQSSTGMGIVAGDMVNTASRIQSAALAGGVLVGEQTFRATEDVFEYAEREAITAKGKSEPVRVWEPVSARVGIGAGARRRSDVPLVGRTGELTLLREAFESTRRIGEPQLVTLVGVPGIGKTRLVSELERLARESEPEITWLEGRSLPYGAGASFWALGEIVKGEAGIMETDDAATAEAKLAEAVARLEVAPSDARWLEGHLRPLVGLAGEGGLREEQQEGTFAAWRRFFELLAARAPLVLVFDDLQWADDDVLTFVLELVQPGGAFPVLVVATARPELLERVRWGDGSQSGTTISLGPLDDDETLDLVRSLSGELALAPETAAVLLGRAGGNPLYAEEFVRIVVDAGRDPGEVLPDSLKGIVAARLDLVSPEEKDVLQDASVVGQVFWPGALAHVRRVDGGQLAGSLDELERKEFVLRVAASKVADETEHAFRHLLIREVAYEQIPRARRAATHRLTAEWIESLPADRAEGRAEMLAHHYAQALDYVRATGGDIRDLASRTSRALREAGDHARALQSLDVAVDRYRQALELLEADDEPHVELELVLAEVELRTGEVDQARIRLDGVLETARSLGRADLFGRAVLARGGVGTTVFDPDEALVALIGEAIERLGDHEPALRSQLTARLAVELYYVPPPSRREELSDRAVRLAREAGTPEALLDALNARHVTLWSPDHLEERLAVARELVELAETSGDRERALQARTWLVLDLVESGDLEAARAEIDDYARLAASLDIPAYSWWVPAWRGMLANVEGRFDEARRLAAEAREIGGRVGDGNAELHAGMIEWQAGFEQGRESHDWVPMAEAGIARGGPANAFRCGLASIHAAAGRLDEARRTLAGLGPSGFGSVTRDMNFFAGGAEFAIAVGVLGDGERAATAYALLRAYGDRNWVIARAAISWGPGHSFLGRLAAAARMWDEAERHFEAGLAACERMGARPMAARTRSWYAEMLRMRGVPDDREHADELSRAAEVEAERLGLVLA
jgi:class 3 adenylate cyclase/tetratricopeptide (TPR) repeat protein